MIIVPTTAGEAEPQTNKVRVLRSVAWTLFIRFEEPDISREAAKVFRRQQKR